MKKYFTWAEFLQKYPRQARYDCDKYSRYIVTELMRQYNTDNIEWTEGNNCSDGIAIANTLSGTQIKIGIEVKDRWNYTSTTKGDHLIELIKLKSLVRRKNNGEFDRMTLFSIFSDGVIAMTENLEKDILGTGNLPCPKTTALDDHTIEYKPVVFYRQNKKFYFYFDELIINNKLETFIHFSLTQPNIEALNKAELQMQKTILF